MYHSDATVASCEGRFITATWCHRPAPYYSELHCGLVQPERWVVNTFWRLLPLCRAAGCRCLRLSGQIGSTFAWETAPAGESPVCCGHSFAFRKPQLPNNGCAGERAGETLNAGRPASGAALRRPAPVWRVRKRLQSC